MSGTSDRNRENPIEAPGPIDRALDRDRDDRMDVLEGGDMRATGAAGTGRDEDLTDRGEVVVPVAEERLNVEKRQGQLGEVEIHKTVEQEQVSVPVELMREEVHVEQRDVADRPAQAGETLFEEGTIRVPVRGEEAVVTKEAVVTGEVVINKERTTERQTVSDTVRRERVEVDRDYEQHREAFQQHYAGRQGQLRDTEHGGRGWEDAEPNYQYGYAAARGGQYGERAFEDIEPELQRDYETRHGGGTGTRAGTGTGAVGTTGATDTSAAGSTTGGATGDAWQHLRDEIREGYNRARSR